MFIIEKLEDKEMIKSMNTLSPFYMAIVKILLYLLLEYMILGQ